ncbi:unnamed protein product [Pleuronectes platessa]|uniref:Uncharacterized protein n=1 Tax=Pleuronectes platessa TaxID=8262 RepID=A0A9N7TXN3_PLEPL|nr:unnamed protein product [Pleuronectes platessa]
MWNIIHQSDQRNTNEHKPKKYWKKTGSKTDNPTEDKGKDRGLTTHREGREGGIELRTVRRRGTHNTARQYLSHYCRAGPFTGRSGAISKKMTSSATAQAELSLHSLVLLPGGQMKTFYLHGLWFGNLRYFSAGPEGIQLFRATVIPGTSGVSTP